MEERKPLVSVIVPVYNVYPYLRDCVQSVQAQSYQNWELLLVDDGSTDGSGELCDELAVEDGRIRVFHKPNGGCLMPETTECIMPGENISAFWTVMICCQRMRWKNWWAFVSSTGQMWPWGSCCNLRQNPSGRPERPV